MIPSTDTKTFDNYIGKISIPTFKLIQNAKVGGVLENMGTELFKIEEEMAQIVHNTQYLLLSSDCSQSEHIRG